MSTSSRGLLNRLIGAFEAHLEALERDRGVDVAFDALADAFERYEASLDDEFHESLPIVLDDDGDDDFDDDDGEVDDSRDESGRRIPIEGFADDGDFDDLEEFDLDTSDNS